MTDSRLVRIYGLRPAGSERFLWVGQTTQLIQSRKRKHWIHAVRSQAKAPISAWFRELGVDGIEAVELEVCDESQKIERETFWTLELRTLVKDGGLNTRLSYGWDGGRPDAAESARKMNERLVSDPELRAAAVQKQKYTMKHRRETDPSIREAQSAGLRKRYEDPAARALTGEKSREVWQRPGYREKMRKARSAARDKRTADSTAGPGANGGAQNERRD